MMYATLQFVSPSLRETREGAWGRIPETGTGEEAVEDHCLLASSPGLLIAS